MTKLNTVSGEAIEFWRKPIISVKEWFAIELLVTRQGFVNAMRANQVIAPSPEKLPWL